MHSVNGGVIIAHHCTGKKISRPTTPSARGLPAVCEETSVGVSGAVATWGGTSRSFCLEGLPVEGRTVEKTLLLSAGCQRTPVGTTVCGVLPTDVTEAVAARHGTSAGSGGKEGNQKAMKGESWRRREEEEVLKPAAGEE